MTTPSVSIIIPVYNSEQFLERCLDSAVNQTLNEFEVICINDGSTDGSVEIIRKFKGIHRNLISLNLKNNQGVSNARNLGIKIATGEFIGFIDSDDYVDKDYFKTLYDYSIGNDYDVIRGIRVIDEIGYHGKNEYGCIVPSIIRRKILTDNPDLRFPTKLKVGEDTQFKRQLFKTTNKIFECPDTGVYYHYIRRNGSLSNYNL